MKIDGPAPKRNLISLTPLIDVVFILLVFFMLASTFSKWSFLGIAIGEGEPTETTDPGQTIVHMKPSLESIPQLVLDEREITIEELRPLLKASLSQDPKHSVLLLPAPELVLQQMVVALEVLQADFGDRVLLAVLPEKLEEAK